MSRSTTPIEIIESYFDVELKRSDLRRFDTVSTEQWVHFARHYLARMNDHFASEFLTPTDQAGGALRLYFEPRLRESFDSVVREHFEPTPLLGIVATPPSAGTTTPDSVSAMLNPLKKHLLLADSVFVRDSFYYCFDGMAELEDGTSISRDQEAMVEGSIRVLKDWLPILAELRPLITSGALVFMPYYVTPSFPYGGSSPKIKGWYERLRMRAGEDQFRKLTPEEQAVSMRGFPSIMAEGFAGAGGGPASPRDPHEAGFNEQEVIGAWLNARLMHLDPVFPTRKMAKWAARLYLDEGSDNPDITGDMMSIAVLPFGDGREITIARLTSMRRDEEVFDEIKRAIAACRTYVAKELGPSATPRGIRDGCRSVIHDALGHHESRSILKFIEDHTVPSMAFSVAVGAAFLVANPLVGLIGGAVLSPGVFRAVQGWFDPKRRALTAVLATL